MLRSIKRTWAVALLTSTEGLRQPAFFLLFGISAFMTFMAPYFSFFHLGESAKMVTDLGMSTVLTFSTLLSLLTASTTITDEIEGKTALTMLSKPLRREEFLIGKYIGVTITSCALVLLMSIVMLVTLRGEQFDAERDRWFRPGVIGGLVLALTIFLGFMIRRLLFNGKTELTRAFWIAWFCASVAILAFVWTMEPKILQTYNADKPGVYGRQPSWDWRILIGMIFICLHNGIISAMAVAFATRLTLVQSAIGTFMFFIVGHMSGGLVAPFRDSASGLSATGSVLRAILPDLDQFNITDALATAYIDTPIQIPFDVVASSSIYAGLYSVALLAVAAALFSRRELG